MRAISIAYLILMDLVTLMTFGEECSTNYEDTRSYHFLGPLVSSIFLGPNIFLYFFTRLFFIWIAWWWSWSSSCMTMGWHYVSELQAPTSLLSIPQVIYEHGEPWWNIDRGQPKIHPRELSCNPTSSHLVAKQKRLTKEMMNLASRNISFILRRVL
jgi:hypothetical protein